MDNELQQVADFIAAAAADNENDGTELSHDDAATILGAADDKPAAAQAAKQTVIGKATYTHAGPHEPVPVEHLDFSFVRACQNPDYLARILEALESGREGRFPELETATTNRLRAMCPEHRALRKSQHLGTTRHMDQPDRDSFLSGLAQLSQLDTVAAAASAPTDSRPPIRNRGAAGPTIGLQRTAPTTAASNQPGSNAAKVSAPATAQRIPG